MTHHSHSSENQEFRFKALPGDMLVALKMMRAWESVDVKGQTNDWIYPQDLVLVLSVWTIDAHQRLVVMTKQGIKIMSSRLTNMGTNWIMPQREALGQRADQ